MSRSELRPLNNETLVAIQRVAERRYAAGERYVDVTTKQLMSLLREIKQHRRECKEIR